MNSFRVANWNLDGYRSGARSRLPQQLNVLLGLLPDVVVLTEVRDTTQLPGMQFWWSNPGQPPYQPSDRAVGIASRWSGEVLPVRDGRLSVCVALKAPLPIGQVVVYGTIIPYAQDGVREGLARSWERHHKAVDDVVADIHALRSNPTYQTARIVVAGDFNTCLDGSRWYGHPEARERLVQGLGRHGLRCHTTEDIRATRAADRAIVDHIWSCTHLEAEEPIHVWCHRAEPGRLSDHNGVAIRLEIA